MNNILYLALAGFIAFVALLLGSLQKPAVMAGSRQPQQRVQKEAAPRLQLGGDDVLLLVVFVVGAALIIVIR